MLAAVYTQALFIVADVAYLRGAGVILAFAAPSSAASGS